MFTALFNFTFYVLPFASVIWFICSLVRYISARRREKEQPGSVSEFELRSRKFNLTGSAVVAGMSIAIVLGIIIMLITVYEHM